MKFLLIIITSSFSWSFLAMASNSIYVDPNKVSIRCDDGIGYLNSILVSDGKSDIISFGNGIYSGYYAENKKISCLNQEISKIYSVISNAIISKKYVEIKIPDETQGNAVLATSTYFSVSNIQLPLEGLEKEVVELKKSVDSLFSRIQQLEASRK